MTAPAGRWFFVSDLHGSPRRYDALFDVVGDERPAALFLGGDLLPGPLGLETGPVGSQEEFLPRVIEAGFEALKSRLGPAYPEVFLILGNDDLRAGEEEVEAAARRGLWRYIHNRRVTFGERDVYGYACCPPSPFLLKDWERYDVSRYVDPGCVAPEEGRFSVAVTPEELRFTTIQRDLEALTAGRMLEEAVILFHTPPYATLLDRAALDGRMVDHVPVDVHVGSVAVRRFIEARRPRVTLHGHIHESARLTGSWREQIGRTHAFSAAHDGPELALVAFTPEAPEEAERRLL